MADEGTDAALQERVNDAVSGTDEGTTATAEHEQDDTGEGEGQESDDTSESGESEQQTTPTSAGTQTSQGDATEEDEEDDDELDYVRPPGIDEGVATDEPFDINKLAADLPRDADGNVDPNQLNAKIQQWMANREAKLNSQSEKAAQATKVLTQQWERVKTKYPHIWDSKELVEMARDMHLNSISSENYMSPMSAAKRIDRMYRKAVKSGVAQQRSHQRVEHMARTETAAGKTETSQTTDYDKARKMALSTDPKVSKEGRRQLMKLRFEARQR